MSNRKSLKHQITEAVLAEVPKSHRIYHELPIESVIFKWWFTGRQAGLRLTDEGVTAFQLADIAFYDYDFSLNHEEKSWHSYILEINRKMKCPYYLGVNKSGTFNKPYIRLYDSKIAMMIGLYGTFIEYLNSIKERND